MDLPELAHLREDNRAQLIKACEQVKIDILQFESLKDRHLDHQPASYWIRRFIEESFVWSDRKEGIPMGSGHVTFIDADKCEEIGWYPTLDFYHCYLSEDDRLFNKRVYHIYTDSGLVINGQQEGRNLDLEDYEAEGLVLGEIEVWS
eukprot:TRINITY_DN22620_c0_g1_i1.p1 TRINITY_DN22620_c0_g1~~TRINITY_DN22620_c0_g1_i1.p1  ORF type:complete len:147 (-),score=14.82 TRINITY_DN22620_c0_g1_i1:24-464(-)